MSSAAGDAGDGGGLKPLWGGRFSKGPAGEAHALGVSLHFDVRFASEDIEASVAHVHALQDAGLLTAGETESLVEALRGIWGEEDDDIVVELPVQDEDIHMLHERKVTEALGDLGAKLHAGRSRNDLVVTDFRLWLLAEGVAIAEDAADLVRTLARRSRETADMVMPGFTHNRPAQVVTVGYVLAAHAFALLRDLERLDQWSARTSVSPLGAGAIATSTLGLDPAKTAERLGFVRPFDNALDAIADRDFALEFLSVCSILALHLSRLAADVARWSEPALGFAHLDDAYSTGSSMMPQKRNPDVAELARGKAGRIAGDLVTLTTILAGLPLGYHRDLQEDKEPVFDAAETLELVLPALSGCIGTLRFDAGSMRAASMDEGLYATDIAEALVIAGVPFREAHRATGELLKSLAEEGRGLRDLHDDGWSAFGLKDGASLLDPDASVRARNMPGGPAPDRVREQCDAIETAVDTPWS
ncbi:MAG: argininosuccinate lyase [Actinomycetota bacterium]